ncbi:hypothetical protein DFR86_06115 [Acidianus sulfidivorans JP7]|uniref:Uncharacterized protein n=1 Tax=Acidianus sulfidivorans JP7 TaxID=619593 RepID=A0A2U9IMC2_9CREN|nr:hypothetical protein [Acidianus sulfidivorans]AWR97178.1 hypothetical protein DFR86_06115 [Acidianus sulfidivorans JP7]
MLKSLSLIIVLLITLNAIISSSYTVTYTFHTELSKIPIKVIINCISPKITNIIFNNVTNSIIIVTKYILKANSSEIALYKVNDSYILTDTYLYNYNTTYNIIILNNTRQIGTITIIVGSPDTSSFTFSSNPLVYNDSKNSYSNSNKLNMFIFILIGIIAIIATILLKVLKTNK